MVTKKAKKSIGKDYYKTLIDHRTLLLKQYQISADHFDRTLVTLASGAIVLTVGFLKDIVPDPLPISIIFLYGSWASFTLSLAAILAAHLMAMNGRKQMIQQIDDAIRTSERNFKWKKNRWARQLSWISFIMFIVGVVLFSYFVFLNL